MVTADLLRKVDTDIPTIERNLVNYMIEAGLGEVTAKTGLVSVLKMSSWGFNYEGLELAGFVHRTYGLDEKTVVDTFYEASSEAAEAHRELTVGNAAKLIYDALK